MRVGRWLGWVGLFLLGMLSACGSEPEPSDEAEPGGLYPPALTDEARSDLLRDLSEAARRWDESGPSDYQMVIEFWNAGTTEASELMVRDGHLVRDQGDPGSFAVWLPEGDPTPFMAWWFGLAQEALEEAHAVEIQFHSELGYPTELHVDYAEQVLDDEVRYVIRELTDGVER